MTERNNRRENGPRYENGKPKKKQKENRKSMQIQSMNEQNETQPTSSLGLF